MYAVDIKKLTKTNTNFRQVLHTGAHSQIVAMSLLPDEEIGMETHHNTDQLLFIVDGQGDVIVSDDARRVEEHDVVFVPAGAEHNVINSGSSPLKLFTVYAPANHADGTVHKTKAEADAAELEEPESEPEADSIHDFSAVNYYGVWLPVPPLVRQIAIP